jgi:hypothetical protein
LLLNSDIEISRKDAKNEREKEHVVAEVLKTFHQFGEFSFAEISSNNFAALRLCVPAVGTA